MSDVMTHLVSCVRGMFGFNARDGIAMPFFGTGRERLFVFCGGGPNGPPLFAFWEKRNAPLPLPWRGGPPGSTTQEG